MYQLPSARLGPRGGASDKGSGGVNSVVATALGAVGAEARDKCAAGANLFVARGLGYVRASLGARGWTPGVEVRADWEIPVHGIVRLGRRF